MPAITAVQPIIGLEIHVELATRTKMFSRAPNPASPQNFDVAPNALIDPTILALPGSLPVMNRAAVDLSIMVGLALGCSISSFSRWDRKSYFYPDSPKNYQISQYDLPLCFDGSVELPPITPTGQIDFDAMAGDIAGSGSPHRGAGETLPGKRIGIIRAHLEEDAGKLLHEAPGGAPIDPPGSIVDYNRAGTPLLEIVTQPDFSSSDEVVVFCRMLRNICRFLGASEGILQRGHIRFEPNINTMLTLDDGRTVKTPIVEIKNLNSFKAVKGAIDYEVSEQPKRWLEDGVELRPGAKTTRGWNDHLSETFLQREKEEAHDYRYFPDPDLPPVGVDDAWRERIRAALPELPLARTRTYMRDFSLSAKEAVALTDERDVAFFFERATESAAALGVQREKAGRLAANFVLQSGGKRANERSTQDHPVLPSDLGITPQQIAQIVKLRDDGSIGSNAADELFGLLCSHPSASAEHLAKQHNMLITHDSGALDAWCNQVIAANPKPADDVRAGKLQAIGRLVSETMKLATASGQAADAKAVREALLKKLGQG